MPQWLPKWPKLIRCTKLCAFQFLEAWHHLGSFCQALIQMLDDKERPRAVWLWLVKSCDSFDVSFFRPLSPERFLHQKSSRDPKKHHETKLQMMILQIQIPYMFTIFSKAPLKGKSTKVQCLRICCRLPRWPSHASRTKTQ